MSDVLRELLMDPQTVLAALVLPLYVGIYVLATQGQRDRKRRLRSFSRALRMALVQNENVESEDHLDGVLSKVESFFEQSSLHRNFGSPVEALKHLQYLMHEDRDGRNSVVKGWTEDERATFDELLRRLRSKMPFAALQGDAQRLLGAVQGHLEDRPGGLNALMELADYIKSVENALRSQKKVNVLVLFFTVISVVLAGIAIFT